MASTAPHKFTNTINVQARAPHVAIAQQVELQGSDIARALYKAAKIFNGEFFDGQLLPCFVEVTPPGSMNALADYRPRTAEGVESHIRIGDRAASKGLRYALDVLLHELVHAWCFEVLEVENDKTERAYNWHGPKWTAKCNQIGRLLGLPEVFAKGRGGPNSARWPLNVRPAGYYGFSEEDEAKRTGATPSRKPAQRKEPKPADPHQAVRDQLCAIIRSADPETLQLVALALQAANT